jgi:hypothetical protein
MIWGTPQRLSAQELQTFEMRFEERLAAKSQILSILGTLKWARLTSGHEWGWSFDGSLLAH